MTLRELLELTQMTLRELLELTLIWINKIYWWGVDAFKSAKDWFFDGYAKLITGNILDLTIGQVAFILITVFVFVVGGKMQYEEWRERTKPKEIPTHKPEDVGFKPDDEGPWG